MPYLVDPPHIAAGQLLYRLVTAVKCPRPQFSRTLLGKSFLVPKPRNVSKARRPTCSQMACSLWSSIISHSERLAAYLSALAPCPVSCRNRCVTSRRCSFTHAAIRSSSSSVWRKGPSGGGVASRLSNCDQGSISRYFVVLEREVGERILEYLVAGRRVA